MKIPGSVRKKRSEENASGEIDRTKALRYSVSLVTQGNHRFYTLTMPSDILAQTCFVTTREEDPDAGFQRTLSKERATQIAEYIDSGLGTIPSSIVLSAQPEAELKDIGKGKTIEFLPNRTSFLVIDGQHRVYGFAKANKRLRVPVVIYNGLSKRDESRLFIDINTKQKPVPNELLLDIKKLAEYENDAERLFGEVYDLFHETPSSPLYGLTNPIARAEGKISRVTFNAAFKPILPVFKDSEGEEVYDVMSSYVRAIKGCLIEIKALKALTNPIFFRAAIALFPAVGARIKDRDEAYSTDNFTAILQPVFERVPRALLSKPRSVTSLLESFTRASKKDFTL